MQSNYDDDDSFKKKRKKKKKLPETEQEFINFYQMNIIGVILIDMPGQHLQQVTQGPQINKIGRVEGSSLPLMTSTSLIISYKLELQLILSKRADLTLLSAHWLILIIQ